MRIYERTNVADLVSINVDKTFGEWFDLTVPPGCDVIIVCAQTNTGLEPKRILLPHQLYERDVRKMVEQHGVGQIVLIPADSSTYISLFTKECRLAPKVVEEEAHA